MGEKARTEQSDLTDAVQSLSWVKTTLSRMSEKLAEYRKGGPPRNGEMTWLYDRSLEVEATLLQLGPVLHDNQDYTSAVSDVEKCSIEIYNIKQNHVNNISRQV